MDTVLGLSLTSTSVGWILLDGPGADAKILDHDAFDLGSATVDDSDVARHVAAVRGAAAIAGSTGHEVKSVNVTWTDDAHAKAVLLLKSLGEADFDNVTSVRLSEAASTWARTFPRTFGFQRCAVCIIEATAVTVLSFGHDNVRTFATHMRESADGLGRWLTDTFEANGLEPEVVFLVGARGDLELTSEGLAETLPIPVDASGEVQLALARGAALASSPPAEPAIDDQVSRIRAGVKAARRRPRARQSAPAATGPDNLVAWTDALKKPARNRAAAAASPSAAREVASEPKTEVITTRTDAPSGRDRILTGLSRYGTHARAATAVVAGMIALFVIVPIFTGNKESTPTEEPPASNSPTTSVSVHAVPSAPMVPSMPAAAHQTAAAPLPPAPLPPAPPPVQEAAPLVEAAAQPSAPAAVVVEPVEAAPPPAQPIEAQPVAAEQPPAAAPEGPAPAAPPPPPGEPVPPEPGPPPPDPVMVVLSPLFGALP
ncbi:DUF7159 family protein [Mycolicibacterium sp. XJ1819]